MGTENATLTATFKVAEYTITVQASPSDGGTVSGGGTGFQYHAPITITATANEGYRFVNWTWTLNGEVVPGNAITQVIVTGDATYVANFEQESKGNPTSYNAPTSRPRDIYPAPAREPWDWDDDFTLAMTNDTIVENDTVNDERGNRPILQPADMPQITNNKATEGNGGGIYLNEGEDDPVRLIFADGNINFNTAKLNGGGIYIDTTAYMQMYGTCEVNANRVSTGQLGGGIYLAGRLYVGQKGDDVDDNGLRVNKNFASTDLLTNLDTTTYKALVAFSVEDKDLATAVGCTLEQLPSKSMSEVMAKLLVLANAITTTSNIAASDLETTLGIAEGSLAGMTVAEYTTAKTAQLTAANGALNNVYLPRDYYDYYEHMEHITHDDYSNVIALLCDISAK